MARLLTDPPDRTLAPGAARCPGPSMADIIATDADNTPAALRQQAYQFMGDADIPFRTYTSDGQYQQELDHLWNRTWQWACREEHIPQVGDWYVYDVGPWSVIVVRGADQRIRAFVNACPHRGMQFADAGTRGSGKQFLRCPFHGMSWELDGSLREIPCHWDFPHVDATNFGLTEVPCDCWEGFVFINLDSAAPPLADYLGVLPDHFDQFPLGLAERFVALHTRKLLPVNWKMAIEGFLEAYHVLATHPEGLPTAADANAQYDVFGDHVSRFVHAIGYPSPHLPGPPDQRALFAALGRDPDSLPAGASARREHATRLRAELGRRWQVDLDAVSTSQLLDSIQYFVFPNACFFPGIGIRLIYRFRPVDVDHTLHEILLLQPTPAGQPRPAPAEPFDLGIDDSYTTVPGFELAQVLDQDTDNFRRQRAGAKASLKTGQTLGNYQEVRVRHLHAAVNRYLADD